MEPLSAGNTNDSIFWSGRQRTTDFRTGSRAAAPLAVRVARSLFVADEGEAPVARVLDDAADEGGAVGVVGDAVDDGRDVAAVDESASRWSAGPQPGPGTGRLLVSLEDVSGQAEVVDGAVHLPVEARH